MENKSFLNQPFKRPGAVSRIVCTKCKRVSEIDKEMFQRFIKTMALLNNFPEISLYAESDYKKYYFEVGYCHHCRRKDKAEDVEVKIKMQG